MSEATEQGRAFGEGRLSVIEIVFFVVAAAAPLAVIVGGGPLAFRMGGIGTPGGYLAAGVIYILLAAGFTAMSRYVRNAGAFYAYISAGLNRRFGAGAALAALLSYAIICIGFYGALGFFGNLTLNQLAGVNVPWQIIALLGIAAVGYFGYRDINIGAKVLGVLMLAEVAILAAIAIGVLATGGPEPMSLVSYAPSNIFATGAGGMFVLAFGAFIGFEGTAIYAEEARDPERTIPRATYISVAFLALFYSFCIWIATVAQGTTGVIAFAQSDDFEAMYFVIAGNYLGDWATAVLQVLIVTSIFAAILAFHNATARYFFALGRDGLLPRALGRTHAEHRSPHMGSLAMSALSALIVGAAIVLGADPYLQLLLWTNGVGIAGIVILQALCCIAIFRFFRNDRRGHGLFRVAAAPLLACAGLVVAAVLMLSNFEILTGVASVGGSILLLLPLVTAFGLGFLRGGRSS